MITWADGTVTTVYPPETPARPANATPVTGRAGHCRSDWFQSQVVQCHIVLLYLLT